MSKAGFFLLRLWGENLFLLSFSASSGYLHSWASGSFLHLQSTSLQPLLLWSHYFLCCLADSFNFPLIKTVMILSGPSSSRIITLLLITAAKHLEIRLRTYLKKPLFSLHIRGQWQAFIAITSTSLKPAFSKMHPISYLKVCGEKKKYVLNQWSNYCIYQTA